VDVTAYAVVEQIGDQVFVVSRHPSECAAMLAAVDAHIDADEERELFVAGPGITQPIAVGAHPRTAN
jgi:hypothetical protein